jgi:uncharacterized protein (DUF1778 family)
MASTTIDRSRITARVPIQVQETLAMAAEMIGATVNQFVIQTALREAERIIEQERVIHLSQRDAVAFLKALEHPLPPNEKLKTALHKHQSVRHDQTGTFDWTPQPKRV